MQPGMNALQAGTTNAAALGWAGLGMRAKERERAID